MFGKKHAVLVLKENLLQNKKRNTPFSSRPEMNIGDSANENKWKRAPNYFSFMTFDSFLFISVHVCHYGRTGAG